MVPLTICAGAFTCVCTHSYCDLSQSGYNHHDQQEERPSRPDTCWSHNKSKHTSSVQPCRILHSAFPSCCIKCLYTEFSILFIGQHFVPPIQDTCSVCLWLTIKMHLYMVCMMTDRSSTTWKILILNMISVKTKEIADHGNMRYA